MAERDAGGDPSAMFDRLFSLRAPNLRILNEDEAHRSFLTDLFVACSPLRGVLPDPVVLHQALMRDTGYRADYPAAMRRVIVAEGVPVGRVMIDWAFDDDALLVDIAVMPDRQRTGLGKAMLHTFLDSVDRRGQRAMLQVAPDNPAMGLYAHLGFAPVVARDFTPYVDMVRAPRSPSG